MTASAKDAVAGKESPNGRHRDIIRTAAQLFRERGYAGTTVRDLASAVGVTSGSLFHHFGTKEEILLGVVEEGLRQTTELIRETSAGQTSPRRRLVAMIHAHLSGLLEGSPETKSVMFYEWWSLSEPARANLVKLRDSYEAVWDQAMADFEGDRVDASERRVKRLLLFGALNWASQWYRPGGAVDVAGLTRIVSDLYFQAR